MPTCPNTSRPSTTTPLATRSLRARSPSGFGRTNDERAAHVLAERPSGILFRRARAAGCGSRHPADSTLQHARNRRAVLASLRTLDLRAESHRAGRPHRRGR